MHNTIAAVVLAGGGGRRLGGADKALIDLAGRPLLAHVLARLSPQVDRIVLSANGDPARFAAFGLPVVSDAAADRGPLAGIAAAAAFCTNRWPDVCYLLSVPVDLPLLPSDLLARLHAAAERAGGCAASASAGGRSHWAVTLWPLPFALTLARRIEAPDGLRRLQDAARLAHGVAVPFPEPEPFANVNRPEDLHRLSAVLREN